MVKKMELPDRTFFAARGFVTIDFIPHNERGLSSFDSLIRRMTNILGEKRVIVQRNRLNDLSRIILKEVPAVSDEYGEIIEVLEIYKVRELYINI